MVDAWCESAHHAVRQPVPYRSLAPAQKLAEDADGIIGQRTAAQMGTRKHPRVKMVLPIRIAGRDLDGNAFSLLSHTLDFSHSGARLGGVHASLRVGDEITLEYKRNRGRFKVRWVDATRKQLGAENLEPEKFVFVELPAEAYVDDVEVKRRREQAENANVTTTTAAAAVAPPPGPSGNAAGPVAAMPEPAKTPAVQQSPAAILAELKRKLQEFKDDTDGALQLVADTTGELVPASGAAVALAAGDEWICRAASGVAPRVGVQFHSPQGLTGEAVRSGKIVICLDTEADARVNASIWRSVQLRSAASIPIICNTRAVGVLEVFAESPDAFGVEHVPLLQGLGTLLANVVANTL
jgi:GAF domain-containing protein